MIHTIIQCIYIIYYFIRYEQLEVLTSYKEDDRLINVNYKVKAIGLRLSIRTLLM